jgi:hypothetical protein
MVVMDIAFSPEFARRQGRRRQSTGGARAADQADEDRADEAVSSRLPSPGRSFGPLENTGSQNAVSKSPGKIPD